MIHDTVKFLSIFGETNFIKVVKSATLKKGKYYGISSYIKALYSSTLVTIPQF